MVFIGAIYRALVRRQTPRNDLLLRDPCAAASTMQDCDGPPRLRRRCGGSRTARRSVGKLDLPLGAEDAHHNPTGDMRRTLRVVVAANIKARVEFFREPVFAHIVGVADFDPGPEPYPARTGHRIGAAANICSGGRDAGRIVGLTRNRIVSGDISAEFMEWRKDASRGGTVNADIEAEASKNYRKAHEVRTQIYL